MTQANTPTPPVPADAAAYFDNVQRLVHELHTAAHNMPGIPSQARPLQGVADVLIDALDYLVNTASWHDRRLWSHDKVLLRRELDDKLAWRLQ